MSGEKLDMSEIEDGLIPPYLLAPKEYAEFKENAEMESSRGGLQRVDKEFSRSEVLIKFNICLLETN